MPLYKKVNNASKMKKFCCRDLRYRAVSESFGELSGKCHHLLSIRTYSIVLTQLQVFCNQLSTNRRALAIMSMFGFGRPQPSSAEKIAAAEQEMDLVTDMFNKYVMPDLFLRLPN
jgi:hypothetical protein